MLDLEVEDITLEPTTVEEPTEVVKEKKSKKKEKIEDDLDTETLNLIRKSELEVVKLMGGDKTRFSGIGEALEPHEFISTGCYSTDKVLGGGLVRGGLYLFSGPRGGSKSSFSAWCLKQFNELLPNKVNLYLEYEGGVDPTFWQMCGLDSSRIQVAQPETTEQGIDILRYTTKSGLYGLIVVDSITAMAPKEEIEKKAEEATMAQNARIFSRNLKQIKQWAKRTGTTVIMIGQERSNIGSYGGGTVISGNGKASEYYADSIFRFSRVTADDIKKGKDIIGLTIQIKNITKNRYTTPFQEATYTLMFPHIDPATGLMTAGIDRYADLREAATDKNIISVSGSWLYYKRGEPDEIKWNGKVDFTQKLKTNTEHYNLIRDLVYGTTSSK